MNHLGLFEGIGGFSLAARWMGWKTVAWCEWNEFCQRVLKHHFPEATPHGDIAKTDFTKYANSIDILTGGFPCQPFSNAGHRAGNKDERYLFGEMFRAIREIKPRWIVAENVYGITTDKFKEVFDEIYTSLEAEGYKIQTYIIPASSVDAPHKRDRVWFVAHSGSGGRAWREQGVRETSPKRPNEAGLPEGGILPGEWRNGLPRPRLFRDDDGLSERLDNITIYKWRNESIKAYGNAIVPQVALQIFKAIEQFESAQNLTPAPIRTGPDGV